MKSNKNSLSKNFSVKEISSVYFETKNLLISLVLMFVLILICCHPEPSHHKVLNVPYRPQENPAWCASACVQMWSHYEGYSYSQEYIANYIGGGGATPQSIATGVGMVQAKRNRIMQCLFK